jgi:hypothetical protein
MTQMNTPMGLIRAFKQGRASEQQRGTRVHGYSDGWDYHQHCNW